MIYLLILVLAAFFQTTIIPLNLCLILLINRVYLVDDKNNFNMAFLTGILLSFLNSKTLGIYSVIFLLFIKISQMFKAIPISKVLTFVLSNIVIFVSVAIVEKLLFGQSINWGKVSTEIIISCFLYISIKIIEEKVFIKEGIRLGPSR